MYALISDIPANLAALEGSIDEERPQTLDPADGS